uniref:Uncharacterized protein n=1 Tax=Oryza sativa subsp. japonica TaxID=39947 RepID=Q5Z615_ORYSJ|nr:hypothetical protein [Oryza sativa Japonica Group]BAD61944.1 hypothetical protein [Oryza sativa Japonica Group]
MHESITTISPVVSSSHAFQRWKQKQPGTSTHQSSDASAATNEQAPGWACVDSNAQAQRYHIVMHPVAESIKRNATAGEGRRLGARFSLPRRVQADSPPLRLRLRRCMRRGHLAAAPPHLRCSAEAATVAAERAPPAGVVPADAQLRPRLGERPPTDAGGFSPRSPRTSEGEEKWGDREKEKEMEEKEGEEKDDTRGGRGGPATGDAATTREKGRPAVARAHGRTKGEHVEGWLPVSSSFAARRWLLMEGGGASGVELGGGGQREMAVAIGCRGGEGMRRGGGSPLTDDAGGEGRTSSKSWLLRAMTSHVRSVVPSVLNGASTKANTGKRKTRDGRGRARLWTSFATALPYRAPVVPCVSYLPRPMPVFTTKRLHISSPLPPPPVFAPDLADSDLGTAAYSRVFVTTALPVAV